MASSVALLQLSLKKTSQENKIGTGKWTTSCHLPLQGPETCHAIAQTHLASSDGLRIIEMENKNVCRCFHKPQRSKFLITYGKETDRKLAVFYRGLIKITSTKPPSFKF